MKDELKPGQKFPTPTPGLGDRVFYESLLRQRPESVMAQDWYETRNTFIDEKQHFLALVWSHFPVCCHTFHLVFFFFFFFCWFLIFFQ
jgi:hypothetical protein